MSPETQAAFTATIDAYDTGYAADVLAATRLVAAAFTHATVKEDFDGPYITFGDAGAKHGPNSGPNGPVAFILNLGDARPGFWQFQCAAGVVPTYGLTIDSPAPEVVAWLTAVLVANPRCTQDITA